ncbi:protein NLRC3 isoform X1 [Dermacentor silvarum]|uniref:protein NLRC3 isoform X1 n=1 Tax=Dermacentor silvarum TaxID=543639 RepID=UPI0021017889|nr:protein NLRC3 isoform X1 [Dermacentor silvarum]
MASGPSDLGDIQREIPCVDFGRLTARIKSISLKLKACGVDLEKPCSKTVQNASRCWITYHLPALNDSLRVVSMHIFEHAPGKFALSSVPNVNTDYQKLECTLLESATLVYSLLKEHRCITRLDVGDTAVLFCYFPKVLCKALRQNKGLVEVRVCPRDVRGVWRETHALTLLSSTLSRLSPGLDVLDINELTPTVESVGGIAEAVRRGRLRHLVIWNGTATKIARRLFRAVECSSSLSVLEIGGTRRLPLSNATILSDALKHNKTLRKLSIEWLGNDAVGTLLKSLKDNTTLEELALVYSYDEPNSILWEGFEALRVNRGLKCLKLVDVNLTSSCAIIIADTLRENDALQEVCLSQNRITDLGAGALAKALQQNSTLKRLDISECMLSWEALSSFLESLSLNTTVEYVRLGLVDVPETWTPSSPLTANLCARLDVKWNTRALEEWAASLRQGEHHFQRLFVGWTADAKSSGVVHWFDAVRASGVSITELVINCPGTVAQEYVETTVSLLESTSSVKKLTVQLTHRSYSYMIAIIRGLSRNKSVSEAAFNQSLHTNQDLKALQELMRKNRTLHRLAFKAHYLTEHAVRSLARALEDNFVLLAFDFDLSPPVSLSPILSILDRNQSLLNRAVDCVLNSSVDEESIRALRLLSEKDSLLDAVADVSGKGRDECRSLVQASVRRL